MIKKHNKAFTAMTLLISISLLTGCGDSPLETNKPPASVVSEATDSGQGSTIEKIEYAEEDYYQVWEQDKVSTITLSGESITTLGTGTVVEGNKVTINEAGTYVVSGELTEGSIEINEQNKGIVRLILNDAKLKCSNSSPLYIKEAGKVVISLEEGTQNVLTDSGEYTFAEGETDEPSATLFSKADLTINGKGTLKVEANYKDGITSKDDLTIMEGTLLVTSVDDGLIGKDRVAIKEGNITINAKGDGIKSTNAADEGKGFINIEGGQFDIIAGAKGIKATSDITIAGGQFAIDSADDSIHSNNCITIQGGEINLTSGDDGIHSDTLLTITDGTIHVTKSYEGLESADITISGGNIQIVAIDDGINVAGGNDGSSINGRPGQNNFQSTGNNKLTINGGYSVIDAAGDGLDANGSIIMTNGTVLVNGPSNNGNGAIDYDGSFDVSGGLLIAAGSLGMMQGISSTSTQPAVLMNFSSTQAANTPISLLDSKGTSLITFAPTKEYQCLLMTSSLLKQGETYTLAYGGTAEGTVEDGLYKEATYTGGSQVTAITLEEIQTYLTESGVTTGNASGPFGAHGGKGQPPTGGNGQPPMREGGQPPVEGKGQMPQRGERPFKEGMIPQEEVVTEQ